MSPLSDDEEKVVEAIIDQGRHGHSPLGYLRAIQEFDRPTLLRALGMVYIDFEDAWVMPEIVEGHERRMDQVETDMGTPWVRRGQEGEA